MCMMWTGGTVVEFRHCILWISEKAIHITDSDNPSNYGRTSCQKKKKNKLEATVLFVYFCKAFDSIHRGNMK